jgi:hypothetical protein
MKSLPNLRFIETENHKSQQPYYFCHQQQHYQNEAEGFFVLYIPVFWLLKRDLEPSFVIRYFISMGFIIKYLKRIWYET